MMIYNMSQLNILELSYLPTGNQLILVNYEDFWNRYNVITAYFAEKCLIHAKRFDAELTAKEYWDKNANVLANNLIEKNLPITNANLADQMYYNYKTPGFFYLTHVIGLYRKFNVTRVLDMCAGWGNHLVAAFVESLKFYCGVDKTKSYSCSGILASSNGSFIISIFMCLLVLRKKLIISSYTLNMQLLGSTPQ